MATVSNSQVETTPSAREIVSDSLAVGVVFALALTVTQRIVGFLRGILFCRLMTDQQLGQWSMVWSFLMLLAPLAVLGLPGSFPRFVEYYRKQGQLRTFIKRMAIISGCTTIAFSTFVFCFPEWFSWMIFRETDQVGIVIAMGVTLIFVSLMNFLTSLFEALRQVRLVTLMRFILGVSFAGGGLLLLMMSEQATAAVTYAYGIGCLAAVIPAVWFFRRYRAQIVDSGPSLSHRSMWVRLAPFAMWLWMCNFLSNCFEAADRYMLIHWSSVEANLAQGMVGQYHSGRVVPLLLVSVAVVLAGVLMPYMSAAWEKGDRKAVRVQLNWTIKIVSLAFTAGSLVLLLLAPYLFAHVLQGRYNDGLAVLPLTLVYCIWFSLLTLAQDYLWVAEKGKWVFVAVGVGLVANLVLNALLIPIWGLWGAVIATAAANALTAVYCYLVNHWNGCRGDFGVWATLVTPLLVLAPSPYGFALFAILVAAALGTNWVFSGEEKQQLAVVGAKLAHKVGWR